MGPTTSTVQITQSIHLSHSSHHKPQTTSDFSITGYYKTIYTRSLYIAFLFYDSSEVKVFFFRVRFGRESEVNLGFWGIHLDLSEEGVEAAGSHEVIDCIVVALIGRSIEGR